MSKVTIAGEQLELLPERAVYWPTRRTLLVADPHFGKAASFRAGGIPVPSGTTADALMRLDTMIKQHAPGRLVFLGDFLHARKGRAPQTLQLLAEWRAQHDALSVVLVRGNHDKHAGDPPAELKIECCNAPMIDVPFALLHHPGQLRDHYTLAGHLHPGALLSGGGRDYERFPCFWFRESSAVLPAFGDFTGLALIEAEQGDRVFVAAGDDVHEIAKTLK
jgi:DNA ligase-associated metallophosphoesterase